jgi:fructosamine-3-kinase
MDARVQAQLDTLLPAEKSGLHAIGGGSIGDSWRAELASGERYFVKHYPDGPEGLVEAEARGLGWLGEAGALGTARVVAVSEEAPLLVLEWIEPGTRRRDFDEALGEGLAHLHAFGADSFGFSEDNFIGSLPQANEACERWPDFYAYRRIEPLVRRAMDAGSLPAGLAREASQLLARFDSLCGPEEEPSRLHGDLWSGNVMVGPEGEAVLIDPAVYGGHREIDLAMMRLFGGFPERTFDAYANQHPLAEEAAERVSLYQLYPLLVHVVLFGGDYVDQFAEALRTYR